MSSLSNAGKSSIQNQINRAFTKGLYGVDPNQLQQKQLQKRIYQQELKRQAQQNQRRKAQEKARQRMQDQKLQRKIQQSIKKQESQKNNKKAPENVNTTNLVYSRMAQTNNTNKNMNNDKKPQKKTYFMESMQNSMVKNTYSSSPEINLYKENDYQNTQANQRDQRTYANEQNHYIPKNTYQIQQDRMYQQQHQNRIRRFQQTLDKKLMEVYNHIEASKKNSNSSNIIDEIRRRLKSNSYMERDHFDLQKSNAKPFQEEFSEFYRLPKGNNNNNNNYSYGAKSRAIKNLDYDSQSRYKSSYRNIAEINRNQQSRFKTQRNDRSEYNDKPQRWGNKRNHNFLGNRQALDYKVDSVLENIDTILQNQSRQNNNY